MKIQPIINNQQYFNKSRYNFKATQNTQKESGMQDKIKDVSSFVLLLGALLWAFEDEIPDYINKKQSTSNKIFRFLTAISALTFGVLSIQKIFGKQSN